MSSISLYFSACALTIFFIKLLNYPAKRFGLVDIPSARKNHNGKIPLTGGLAIFLAATITLFMQGTLNSVYAAIFSAASVLIAVGVCDDRYGLSAYSRFIAQTIAALLMVYTGEVVISDVGNLLGDGTIYLGAWAVPFTVFCVAGVTNAINMLDGIDGLAGGFIFVVMLIFGYSALLSGNTSQATLLFLLASAVAGFIVFNMRSPWRSRASVFMGDSGSMMLGFATAWFAIDLTQQASGAFTPITAVWILGIPIFDTVSIMLRRVFLGRSPFSPDHGHLHHILLRIGFSVPQTVVLIILLSIAFGLAGISAHYFGLPEYMMFYSFIILFLGYFVITLYAWKLTMPTEESCATQFGPEA